MTLTPDEQQAKDDFECDPHQRAAAFKAWYRFEHRLQPLNPDGRTTHLACLSFLWGWRMARHWTPPAELTE
jgi:hypothetical protein